MWQFIARLILRKKVTILVIIGLITAFMAYQGFQVKMSYELTRMLPKDDPANIEYEHFKSQFGQDGSVILVAIEDPDLYTLEHFNDWYDLCNKVDEEPGVEAVLSVSRIYNLVKNDSLKKFDFVKIVNSRPTTQQEVDSIKNLIYSLPLYDGLLFNKKTNVSLMMITLDKEILNSKKRIPLIHDLTAEINQFGQKYNIDVKYSGLPYIRTITTKKVQDELLFFVIMLLIIASILLFLLFRTARAVLFAMTVVLISVIWVLGTIVLFGYKITILTGILPPLLIIIGVENSIFLLNNYLSEFKGHGNKIKALTRMIGRIGKANLLTNATTAAGFASFIVTGNKLLVEFGIIASINILLIYLLSMFLIPILFSFFPVPKARHMKHLDRGPLTKVIEKISFIVLNRRTVIYITTIIIVIGGIYGITQLKTTGNIVDDISKKEKLYQDLIFLEKNFNGVMPLEITIDTKKKNGILRLSTLQKIDQLEDTLASYGEFSKPLSVVEVVKSAKQAFYNGNPKMYSLPNNQEKNFILSYVPNLGNNKKKSILDSFVDSTLSITRVSIQMANLGTNQIEVLLDDLTPKVDSIFPEKDYEVHITGTSVVFLKGTNYLVENLFWSLALAIVLITILMAGIFSSFRMILISLIPNIIPQIMTAGMMGYFGISIKPSTILIFSIALGISVDNTIQFLSRYKLNLQNKNLSIQQAILAALNETASSMIYTGIVLFCGFFIFTFSSFGGTQALGYLISFTLFVALFTNLFVLPSLLLSVGKSKITKEFKETPITIFEEENQIKNDIPGSEEPKSPDTDKYIKL